MKHEQIIIDRRNKLQKEFEDILELRKQVSKSIGSEDSNNYFQETLEGLQKQLDLIDWILN